MSDSQRSMTRIPAPVCIIAEIVWSLGLLGAASPLLLADTLPRIVCLGTSLTAGFGLDDPDQAWPALVQKKVDEAGLRYRVVNAGVSGETSAGALRRVDWVLKDQAAVLVVETGANDGLRGQDPAATRANIQGICDRARRQSPPPKLVYTLECAERPSA